MGITMELRREIQCEFCNRYKPIAFYGEADPTEMDSLFSPIYCHDCDTRFMAMGYTQRIYLTS